MKKLIRNLLLTIFTIFIFSGCGAESELEDMGITFTQDDYFKYGVYKQDIAVIELFLEAGMDVNTENSKGLTVLIQALKKGNLDLLKLLVEDYDIDVSKGNLLKYPMGWYSKEEEKFMKITTYLLSKGAVFSEKSVKELIYKLEDLYPIYFDTFTLLAKSGLNKENSTLILKGLYKTFIYHLSKKVKKEWVQKNPDWGNTHYRYKYPVLAENEVKVELEKAMVLAKLLIKNGADIKDAYKDFGFGLSHNMHLYRGEWMISFIKLALDNGVDINSRVFYRGSPLLYWTLENLTRIENVKNVVKFMLENGADPLLPQTKGWRGYNKSPIQSFCEYSPGLSNKSKPSDFYPEICQNKKDSEVFKTLFLNPEKYGEIVNKKANLIKARTALKKKNYSKAFELFLPYAEDGNLEAMREIASRYDFGEGVEKNKEKAFYWYQKAVNANAQNYYPYYRLGSMLSNKKLNLIERDFLKAVELLEKAKTFTDKKTEARKQVDKKLKKIKNYSNLLSKESYEEALDIAEGFYKEKKYSIAYDLMLIHAKKGKTKAIEKVASAYYFGDGIKKNKIKAMEWYQKAIEKEDVSYYPYYRLAIANALGNSGITKNLQQAKNLANRSLQIAQSKNQKKAQKQVEKLLNDIDKGAFNEK